MNNENNPSNDTLSEDINSLPVRLLAVLVSACFIMYYSTMPIILGRAAESLSLSESDIGFLAGAFAGGVVLAFVCQTLLSMLISFLLP